MIPVNSLMEFLIILVVSLAGSLGNDYYNTISGSESEINIARVILGAFTGAILIFGISEHLNKLDSKLFTLLCFISGIGGFKSFKWLKTIHISSFVKKIISGYLGVDIDDSTEQKSDTKEDNKEEK